MSNTNENTQSQYTLTEKGIGLKMYDSKKKDPNTGRPKKFLTGSDKVNLKKVFATPFVTKNGVNGLSVNIIDGFMGTYTNQNGEQFEVVNTPERDQQVSRSFFLYEQTAGSAIYTNSKNEVLVSPVPAGDPNDPKSQYRPQFNIKVLVDLAPTQTTPQEEQSFISTADIPF